jgi:hypothetical protein
VRIVLETDFETDQEGMTVPYPPLYDDIRRNHGFVDIRGRPDLASKIPEASQSPALTDLLLGLSEPHSPLFTLGCDLGAHEEMSSDVGARCVAGGYVQLMQASHSDRSPEDYTTLGYAIAQVLEDKAQGHNWFMRFVLQLVALTLDDTSELTPSLSIWFDATAHTPEAAFTSREVLIGSLQDALTHERIVSFLEEGSDAEEDKTNNCAAGP